MISSVLYPCITNVIFANLNLSACNFNPQLPVPIIDRHLYTFTFSKLNLNLYTWTVNLINVFCLLYCRQLCPAWNSRDISLFSTASNKSRGKHMGKISREFKFLWNFLVKLTWMFSLSLSWKSRMGQLAVVASILHDAVWNSRYRMIESGLQSST